MSNPPARITPARRPPPLSVRLNPDELEALRRRAGSVPLSTYLKQVALGSELPARRVSRNSHADRARLAQILAILGQSRLASNFNQLAKAVNLGCLPVNEQTEADLQRGCAEIIAIRQLLMTALGLKNEGRSAL
ncbi:hypothetical protein [Phreatobacter stygius]|uniref:MobC family plasmid mobilization relaxosome protein n=1 Tax=Phreatobacter stygius TaxID=1940610 RepID=A0A4D7AZ77_9HYPH|nr:hypothetical protein [Phreatobacter stygius]QCI63958.1 hypothetical protein E8M01_06675 [Phreatobacter stygius]